MKKTPEIRIFNNKRMLWVDGNPFIAMGAEFTWSKIRHGMYSQTQSSYDYLFPAAKKMEMNCVLVAVKWDQVEPERGKYDFSYIDHLIEQCEKNCMKLIICWFGHNGSDKGSIYRFYDPVKRDKGTDYWTDSRGNKISPGWQFAPSYIIDNHGKYPRAVDADGNPHHNTLCYANTQTVREETRAYGAMMRHLKEHDRNRTVIMIQLENEIAPFGMPRNDTRLWRCHCDRCNRLFKKGKFTNDLEFTNRWFAEFLIKPLSDAGHRIHPIPQYLNFVAFNIAHWMVGGSPGEDVKTIMELCPNISFCGLNLYMGPEIPIDITALHCYRTGRNIPAITETNSDNSMYSPRNIFTAVAEFSCAAFLPWAISCASPAHGAPYVLEDGTITESGIEMRDSFYPLARAMYPLAKYSGTDRIFCFTKGDRTSYKFGNTTANIEAGEKGRGIIVNPGRNEFVVLGTGFKVEFTPFAKYFTCERGSFSGPSWIPEKDAVYSVEKNGITVDIPTPQVVRLNSISQR